MLLRRLDRYILAEILGPLLLSFFVFTTILLLQALFKAADLIIGSGVEARLVGRLLLLSMPWVVVMTIPIAFLCGVMIAVGRLSGESELVAIRASGVSLFTLYRPILLFSALLALANAYLMIVVLPQGNHALQQLRFEILTESLTDEVEPRVPHTGWQNRMLIVFETPPGEHRWKGAFLSEAIPSQESEVIVAEWGRAQTADGEVLLSFDNAYHHRVNLDDPSGYKMISHNELHHRLASQAPQAATSVKRSLRELSFADLLARARDDDSSELVRNLAWIELHKKLSFPAACLVFGLLALPLGFNNTRGGRSSGFVVSLSVILVYYILLSSGEDIARDGTVPPAIAVWFPNVALLVVGLFLVARRNRDQSLLLAGFDQWVQEHLWSRLLRFQRHREAQKAARRRTASESRRQQAQLILRLPELRLRFPNPMDRYVLQTFVRTLCVVTFAGVTVYLAADLTDRIDQILENEIPRQMVFDYYKFKSFAILSQIAPLIVLTATLISFGLLSRSNEITACKALGISLYRLAFPVVLAAAGLASLAFLLQSEILPASSSRVTELESVIMGREKPEQARRADRRWILGKDNQLYNYGFYDEKARTLHRLQVFQFDEAYRLKSRLFVSLATYAEDGWWQLESGWARTFDGQKVVAQSRFNETQKHRLESPEYFSGGLLLPDEMSYLELREYVRDLEDSGQEVPQLEVALHNKIAYPLLSLVMALVALPFAFKLERQGALYGIGVSLLLGVVLLIFLSVFSALGENAVLPPVVAVWSPHMIFSVFSVYLFLGVRT